VALLAEELDLTPLLTEDMERPLTGLMDTQTVSTREAFILPSLTLRRKTAPRYNVRLNIPESTLV
jgi:hypothetical protein